MTRSDFFRGIFTPDVHSGLLTFAQQEKRNAIGRRRSNFPNVEWERFRWREVGRSPVNFVARSAVWEVVREKRKAVLGVGSRTVEWGLISGK